MLKERRSVCQCRDEGKVYFSSRIVCYLIQSLKVDVFFFLSLSPS